MRQGTFHFAPNTQCPLTIPCLLHRELHCSTSPFLRKEGLCCPFETFSRSVAILSSSPPQAQPICIATWENLRHHRCFLQYSTPLQSAVSDAMLHTVERVRLAKRSKAKQRLQKGSERRKSGNDHVRANTSNLMLC